MIPEEDIRIEKEITKLLEQDVCSIWKFAGVNECGGCVAMIYCDIAQYHDLRVENEVIENQLRSIGDL